MNYLPNHINTPKIQIFQQLKFIILYNISHRKTPNFQTPHRTKTDPPNIPTPTKNSHQSPPKPTPKSTRNQPLTLHHSTINHGRARRPKRAPSAAAARVSVRCQPVQGRSAPRGGRAGRYGPAVPRSHAPRARAPHRAPARAAASGNVVGRFDFFFTSVSWEQLARRPCAADA